MKQKLIKPSKPILKNNYFCYIRLKKDEVDISSVKEIAKAKGFREQTFRHITILSSGNFVAIQTSLSKGERQKINNQIRRKIKELDWSYEEKDTYLISKKVNKNENRQSYICTIKMPAIDKFFRYVNKLLHLDIPTQYPHITLFTKGESKNFSYYGISIPSKKEFKTLKPKKII